MSENLEENIEELELYKEITDQIANKFLEIKSIIDNVSLNKATEQMLNLKQIVTEVKFALDTMTSFTILGKIGIGEDFGEAIKEYIGSLELPKLNVTPKDVLLNVKTKIKTFGMEKLTEMRSMIARPDLIGSMLSYKAEIRSEKFFEGLGKMRVGALNSFKSMGTGSVKIFSAMGTGIMGVIPAFKMLTASAGKFLMTMLTSPVTWIILGIALAVMVVINAFKMLSASSNEDVQSLMNGFKEVGQFIMGVGKVIFNVLVAVVVVVITLIAKVVGFAREHLQGGIFESLKNKIVGFVEIVANMFKGFFEIVDKFCGTNFTAKFNIKGTIDTNEDISKTVTDSNASLGDDGTGVPDSASTLVTEGMTGTDISNMESQLNPATDVPFTPTNETFDNSIYGNETKETMIEKLTVNAESVYFVSEKEYQEIEKNQTITTPNESGSNALDPNTVTDSGKNNDKLIRELAKHGDIYPSFNFTGDIRIKEDLETISNYILSKLKADCYNGSNVTQNFVGAGHGHFGKAASWIAIKQGIYAY